MNEKTREEEILTLTTMVCMLWPTALLSDALRPMKALEHAVGLLTFKMTEWGLYGPLHAQVWALLRTVGFSNGLKREATGDELRTWSRPRLIQFAINNMGMSIGEANSAKDSHYLVNKALESGVEIPITEFPRYMDEGVRRARTLHDMMYTKDPISDETVRSLVVEMNKLVMANYHVRTQEWSFIHFEVEAGIATVIHTRRANNMPMVDPALAAKKLTKAMIIALNLADDCSGVVCGSGNYPPHGRSSYEYNLKKALGGGVWVNGNTLISLKERGFIVASTTRRNNQVINQLTDAGIERLRVERASKK